MSNLYTIDSYPTGLFRDNYVWKGRDTLCKMVDLCDRIGIRPFIITTRPEEVKWEIAKRFGANAPEVNISGPSEIDPDATTGGVVIFADEAAYLDSAISQFEPYWCAFPLSDKRVREFHCDNMFSYLPGCATAPQVIATYMCEHREEMIDNVQRHAASIDLRFEINENPVHFTWFMETDTLICHYQHKLLFVGYAPMSLIMHAGVCIPYQGSIDNEFYTDIAAEVLKAIKAYFEKVSSTVITRLLECNDAYHTIAALPDDKYSLILVVDGITYQLQLQEDKHFRVIDLITTTVVYTTRCGDEMVHSAKRMFYNFFVEAYPEIERPLENKNVCAELWYNFMQEVRHECLD